MNNSAYICTVEDPLKAFESKDSPTVISGLSTRTPKHTAKPPVQPRGLSHFNRDTIKVSFPLVKWAADNNHIPMLAIWLKLKRKWKSGHIHNLTHQGINRNTLANWLKALRELGLAWKNKHGWHLVSINRATKELTGYTHTYKIISFKNGSKHDVVVHIRGLLIKSNYNRKRCQQSMPVKGKNKYGHKPIVFISDKLSGILCGRSKSTGRRLKKELHKKKVIRFKKSKPELILAGVSYKVYLERLSWYIHRSYEYFREGCIWQARPDHITGLI